MTDVHSVADDQVRSAFQRWKNLEEEKARIADDLKELFGEQKALGHDTKAMRAAFRLKVKLDEARPEDAEHEALVDTYLAALEAPRASRAYARENIEQFDANPRLIKQVVDGMQTEAGRAALIAAVDIMIEREEAEEAEPEAAAEVTGNDLREPAAAERGQIIREGDAPRETDRVGGDASCLDTDQPGTATELSDALEPTRGEHQAIASSEHGRSHGQAAGRSPESQMDGETDPVTAGETAPHSEKATVATQGEATEATSAEREDRAAANAGGTDVARSAPRAGLSDPTSNTGEGAANTALPAKSRLRPNCLQPELCRSGTRDHCYSCRKAMEREDAA